MNYTLTSRLSVIVLSMVMILFGVYHFLFPKNLLVFVPDYLPGGIIWVYLTGGAFILTALSFLSHKKVRLAAILLVIMLALFAFTIHLPNYLYAGDKDLQQVALINMLKDLALSAFALHIASNAKTV